MDQLEADFPERKNKSGYIAKYRALHPEKIREARMRRYYANKEQDKIWRQNGINRLRNDIIGAYGGKCSMCKEEDQDLLVLVWTGEGPDPHKSDNGGNTKRFRNIRNSKFPRGYSLRCYNCDAKTRKIGRTEIIEAEKKSGMEQIRIDKFSDFMDKISN